MACGTTTLKSCLGLLSLFFWACAVTLVVIGSLILTRYGRITELAKSTDILVPSVIVIGAGVFLFIVGLLGCIGGLKGNKAALALFFILTLLVLVGEIMAVAFGYHYKSTKLNGELTNKLHRMLQDCANDTDKALCDELDFLQSNLKCCGADTYEDWFKWSTNNHSVPQSCCRIPNCQTPGKGVNATGIYLKGCSTELNSLLETYFEWIFVGTIIIVILQVLGLVSTCVMLFRSQETPYLSLDSQGYRV